MYTGVHFVVPLECGVCDYCILMDYFDLRCENNMLHVLNYIIVLLNIAVANDI